MSNTISSLYSAPLSTQTPITTRPYVTGAILDPNTDNLQQLYQKLTDYLSQELGVSVNYKPVTDYAAAVTVFRIGDLNRVLFGEITRGHARLQVPEARAIANGRKYAKGYAH